VTALLRSLRQMPFVFKAGLTACLVLGLYLVIVEPVVEVLGAMNSRADRIEQSLARDKALKNPDAEETRVVREVQSRLGWPARPGSDGSGAETLYRVVNRVLAEHDVEGASIAERTDQLRTDLSVSLLVGDSGADKLDRIGLEVTFESDAITAIAVLAALEQAPEIAAVSRVKIDKALGRGDAGETELLRVTLNPELWVPARDESGGGTR
jgi:hypothetical protein